jgi:hypothetical protein
VLPANGHTNIKEKTLAKEPKLNALQTLRAREGDIALHNQLAVADVPIGLERKQPVRWCPKSLLQLRCSSPLVSRASCMWQALYVGCISISSCNRLLEHAPGILDDVFCARLSADKCLIAVHIWPVLAGHDLQHGREQATSVMIEQSMHSQSQWTLQVRPVGSSSIILQNDPELKRHAA